MRPILPPLCGTLAESALWDVQLQSLYWVDITTGLLHPFSPIAGDHRSWDFHEGISCIVLSEGHEPLIAGVSGVSRFTPHDCPRSLWVHFSPQPEGMRPNDGKASPDGSFSVGIMQDQHDSSPSGQLFRSTSDGHVECMVNAFMTSNVFVWLPDGGTHYFSESCSMSVTRWSIDSSIGCMHYPIFFLPYSDRQGNPDGACIYLESNYVVCETYSGYAYACKPDSTLQHSVGLGTGMVTTSCFGDFELDPAYVMSLTDRNISSVTFSHWRMPGVCGRSPPSNLCEKLQLYPKSLAGYCSATRNQI